MKPLIRRIALALALAVSAGDTASASFPSDMSRCLDDQSRIAEFRGVVSARAGAGVFERASGFADAEGTRPITRDTPFRLASVGKVFTRVAIGLLMDGGKLRLDDPVRRHLPELPETFAAITVAHLMEHRSGVAPMTRPDMADGPAMAEATRARQLVPLVASKPLGFEAGQQEQYSNGGYLLLGALIEAVSGESYRDFIGRHVFDAVGMPHSSFDPGSDAATPLTRLTPPGQPPSTTPQPRMEFAALKASAAGDALSSASDLEAMARALIGDELLRPSTKAAVFPRGAKRWQLGQAGGAAGSNVGFWVYPDASAWLIVLSNIDPPGANLVSEALRPVVLGGACAPNAPKAMPPH
jgi:CubicO group peptidase (beta-lactamase class C family)